jgi:outer membrane receptor for ferrienterochelin and colicins
MKFKFGIIVVSLVLAFSFQVSIYGQNTSIEVIDEVSQKGIPFANVTLYKIDGELIKGMITDGNGLANFNLNQRASYKVSFLGFESLEGQISANEHITLEMIEQYDMLDNVVVTGQYEAKKADQSIYKIDVVDHLEMQQRGVNNLAEALSQETFIRLTTDPATGTSLEMQGMGGENVKYLIDGVPIVGRVAGDIDLSQINMDNVDHIEIVQGPMSVVYGTSALAGVINIITKKNTSNRNFLKLNGYVDSKTNYNVGLYASIIRGKNTFTLSGNRNMFQGIDLDLNVDEDNDTGEDRYMEFKPKLVYNGAFEYGYNKNDFGLKVKTDFMQSELRNYVNPNPDTKLARDNYFITLRSINSITVNDKMSESLHYNIVGAYTYFKRDTENILSDLSELTHTHTGTTTTIFYNLMTRGSFTLAPSESKLNYQFGWDINYDKGTGERIDEENAKMADYAAFASLQWEPVEKLSVQPGLRFIYNTSFEAPVIPSINVQWKIIKDLNFRISYAKGFRAPSLKELYLDFQDVNHNLKGNPDLLAETTNSYNSSLTYKYRKDKFLLKVEPSVFYNDGKDVITLIVTDPQANAAETTNLGGRRTLGVNFNIAIVYSGLNLSAGYSLTGESYDYRGTGTWTPVVNYSNYTFNGKYNFKKIGLILMANYKLYGETPSLAPLPGHPGEFYNIYTEPFSDLEVTLSKQFIKDKLNVVIGGKNLLDNYSSRTYGYLDGSEFLSPINYGRTYFIKANYSF